MKLSDIFKTEDDLADWIDRHPFNWRGGFSHVYDLSEYGDYVLKVTEDEPYLSFLTFVERNIDMNLPIIYDIWVIDGCYYVLMERLYRHQLYISERAVEHGWYEFNTDLWKGLSPTLDVTLDKLDSWYDACKDVHGLKFDLRDSNIMQRRDGTLVITDPFSGEYYL